MFVVAYTLAVIVVWDYLVQICNRISQEEFRQSMQNVYGKLDEFERVEVEKLFRADLFESGIEEGISQSEFNAAMTWLKENPNKHVLEDSDIAVIERYFAEHLKD